MARPKKAVHELRSHIIRFTASPAEYVSIHKRAADSGLRLSDYCRASALKQEITVHKTAGIDDALFTELRRIGVNLNQAVRFLNSTGSVPPELHTTQQALQRFLKENLGHGPEGSG